MADDDEDWTGTPPEGLRTAADADPGFWARNWPAVTAAFTALAVLAVVVLVLAL